MPKLSRAMKKYLRAIGTKGGQAKVTKGFGSRTPEERSANAKAAAAARWGKKRKGGGKK
jgi:hypothetical protein